jgi:hypothetical protein
VDLVGFVDFRSLAEAGIDGSSARLGLFRIFERTLSDAEMHERPRWPSKTSCGTNEVVDGDSVERYTVTVREGRPTICLLYLMISWTIWRRTVITVF